MTAAQGNISGTPWDMATEEERSERQVENSVIALKIAGGTFLPFATFFLNIETSGQYPIAFALVAAGGAYTAMTHTFNMMALGKAETIEEFQAISERSSWLPSSLPKSTLAAAVTLGVGALMYHFGNTVNETTKYHHVSEEERQALACHAGTNKPSIIATADNKEWIIPLPSAAHS